MLLALAISLAQAPSDLDALTRGVGELKIEGLPGFVQAIGPDSFPLLVGPDRRRFEPLGAAGRLGRGRVAAFGHGGFLRPTGGTQSGAGRLLANTLRWTSGKPNPRVGVINGGIGAAVRELGFETVDIKLESIPANVDVVITDNTAAIGQLAQFVAQGKGLIAASTPWGWLQVNPGKDLATEHALNTVMHQAGLTFADGYNSNYRVATASESTAANAYLALRGMRAGQSTDGEAVLGAYRAVPAGNAFAREVRAAVANVPDSIPTEAKPIRADQPLQRLKFAVAPPNSGYDFPGPVAPGARRTTVSARIETGGGDWQSVGAYAAPNETIRVTVPASMVGKGYQLQIGAHSDQIWHLAEWKRHPNVLTRVPIGSATVTASSPFGGLVYIVAPRGDTGSVDVRVDNVVPAPILRDGGDVAAWRRGLELGAPWTEIHAKHLILTVPTVDAKKVKDPQALIDLWNKCRDLMSELDGRPLARRPERFVPDRQISAGYMHAGYPIMTHMDAIELSLSVDQLTTKGSWGHWHELGHNHQKDEWTFGGTGEVTCNFYSLYLMEKIAGQSLWSRVGKNRDEQLPKYLADGAKFATWQSEPFLALTMYAQLIDAFGYEALTETLKSYEGPNAGTLPRNDLERRDQWMIRYSRTINRNLGPFFQKWGVPTSEAARREIAGLPSWMPAGW